MRMPRLFSWEDLMPRFYPLFKFVVTHNAVTHRCGSL